MNETRRILSAAVLGLCLSAPAPAQQAAPAPPAAPQAETELADREAQLRAAEARLQEAARDVARLSRDLAPISLEIAEELLADTSRPRLGVSLAAEEVVTSDGTRERSGVKVLGVSPGSAAEAAGIRAGDVLVGFQGEGLRDKSASDAVEVISAGLEDAKVGDRFSLRIERDGDEQGVEVTLTEASFAPGILAMAAGPGARELRVLERAKLGEIRREMEALRGIEQEREVLRMGGPDVERFVFISSNSPWASMELVELSPRLGEYFDVDAGLLVVRAPGDVTLGFEDGDVIRTIGGRAPENVGHAMRILRSYAGGERLEVEIVRDGRRRTLEIDVPETVGRRGDAGGVRRRFEAAPDAPTSAPAPTAAPAPSAGLAPAMPR